MLEAKLMPVDASITISFSHFIAGSFKEVQANYFLSKFT